MPEIESYLYRIQTDPSASADPVATAFFGERATVEGQVFDRPIASQVSWPLGSGDTVTVGELTLTYAQVSAFVVAIAHQVRAEQNP
jgi:hypothetical protein